MLGSGHLTGYSVDDPALRGAGDRRLAKLADPAVFAEKYGLDPDHAVLLFAMGDGNHSLATAKAIWEQIKARVGMSIIPPAMRWSRSRTSTTPGWSSSRSTACSSTSRTTSSAALRTFLRALPPRAVRDQPRP